MRYELRHFSYSEMRHAKSRSTPSMALPRPGGTAGRTRGTAALLHCCIPASGPGDRCGRPQYNSFSSSESSRRSRTERICLHECMDSSFAEQLFHGSLTFDSMRMSKRVRPKFRPRQPPVFWATVSRTYTVGPPAHLPHLRANLRKNATSHLTDSLTQIDSLMP